MQMQTRSDPAAGAANGSAVAASYRRLAAVFQEFARERYAGRTFRRGDAYFALALRLQAQARQFEREASDGR